MKMKNREKAWCEPCDKDVHYYLEELQVTATIDGVTFTYPYLQAHCKHCGHVVSPYSIGEINDLALYDGYKKHVGLLTSGEIIAIRKKMGLTQEGLAKLMGCGQKTITRYENGRIQDRAFDNFIRCLDELYDLKFLSKKEQSKDHHKSIFDKLKTPTVSQN